MNSKSKPSKQDQTNQRQKRRQEQGPPKQGKNPNMPHGDLSPHHEQEHPETRMTR